MIYDGADGALADKDFVGLRLNGAGQLVAQIIDDNSAPIVLPQAGIINRNDYRVFFFSTDAVTFQWGPNGHLQMVYL